MPRVKIRLYGGLSGYHQGSAASFLARHRAGKKLPDDAASAGAAAKRPVPKYHTQKRPRKENQLASLRGRFGACPRFVQTAAMLFHFATGPNFFCGTGRFLQGMRRLKPPARRVSIIFLLSDGVPAPHSVPRSLPPRTKRAQGQRSRSRAPPSQCRPPCPC